jgi:DNA-binding NtrC family response regulator
MTIPRRGEVMMIMENDATLAEAVRKHIVLTLACCGGNRTHAAKILDISLRCLRDKLRGYAKAGVRLTPVQQSKAETRAGGSALS